MADLELFGVSKLFPDGTKAVDRLDLTVRDGELVVLVGPSGSGKTTTLRLIAGLAQPTGGTIRIGGRDVTAMSPRDRDVAMVFQEAGLYGHLTAYENVAFGLRLRRKGGWFSVRSGEQLTASEIDQRVRQTASLLGITPLLDRRPAELSGGQQQRVALGRAIVRRPRVLLLDEPLASLDVPTRLSLRRELARLHQELKTTTIYVTHDQAEAMALGERIAVMNEGRLEQAGAPEEIYERPRSQFVGAFFGPQGMNFLAGQLESAESGAVFRRERIEVRLPAAGCFPPAGKWRLGIRPESVRLGAAESRDDGNQLPLGSGTITGVEHSGESTFVRLRLETGERASEAATENEWVCRCEPFAAAAVGERKQVTVDRRRLHWFSPTSGKRFEGTDETEH